MSTILIVDDDPDLAMAVGDYFAEHGFSVSSANDGPTGLKKALSQRFDLVMLDVLMPGLDGFEVMRRLRIQSDVPVLMLTGNGEPANRILGLNSGADDYVSKPFDAPELVARVRAILRRTKSSLGTGGPLESGGILLDPASRRVYDNGKAVRLTDLEFEILRILMRSTPRIVSRDMLIQELYGREASPFDRTIDVHVSHLRKKLDGQDDLIQTVRGVGYLFVQPDANYRTPS